MKKKIILFSPSISCGGAERVANLLASGLRELGHTPYFAVASDRTESLSQTAANVEIFNLNCGKPIRGLRKLSALVKSIDPDAVIAFGMHTGIAASLSKAVYRWKTPILIRNENNIEADWQGADRINRVIGPALSRWAAHSSRIITVSESMTDPTIRYLRCSKSNVIAIPNPVFEDSTTFEDAAAPLHPWLAENKTPTFVAMGRLEHQKGFDTLIDAFNLTRARHDARLIIFGNGNLREGLQRKIELLGLSDHIDMPGFTDAPMLQMKAATAFVLSSRFEGFGLVLVEALASGTAVISTDCKFGPSEILEDGRYGTLVPIENPEKMSHALTLAITGPVSTTRPSKKWFQQFSATTAARRHLELIP